jgi:hypothetical protein
MGCQWAYQEFLPTAKQPGADRKIRGITSIMPAERPSLLIRRLTTTLRFQVVSDNTNPKDGGEHGHFND